MNWVETPFGFVNLDQVVYAALVEEPKGHFKIFAHTGTQRVALSESDDRDEIRADYDSLRAMLGIPAPE